MNEWPHRLLLIALTCACASTHAAIARTSSPHPSVTRFIDDSAVELSEGSAREVVRAGERFGDWTLMAIASNEPRCAVLEDFTRKDGHLLFVDVHGVQLDLPKSLESTSASPHLYLGHSREDVSASATDLLSDDILAKPGDPHYAEIADAFAPIQVVNAGTYSFVGTPDSIDKVGFSYAGRSPNFDPAIEQPSIEKIVKAGDVWNGLVGDYLPVLRFVYPEANGDWTELLAFAPFHAANGNTRIQPVWYRIARIEGGLLKWSRYVDTYQPFPPRAINNPQSFYPDLVALKHRWDEILHSAMTIEVPDKRVEHIARLSLIRAIMTRVGDFPKYGVVDRNYAGSEHDGFPDTFTVETAAMLEWGLIERAGRYIDNYFGEFVRDDGSILYRGPETGQFGRMLTVVAQYANEGGDPQLLLRQRRRIDAITRVLLSLRTKALQLPPGDAAYGMIAGWSEADSCLERDPSRYMQPYFSNSTEAARGFRDLGEVWEKIGQASANGELVSWGQRLVRESELLRKDIDASIARSLLQIDGKPVLPAIAGVKEPFDVVVRRDNVDPQYRSYRAYMEMMYSGSLTPEQTRMIVDYRSSHHDVLLGIPTAYGYNTGEVAGFLLYGYGYGLIRADMIREALLTFYSDIAHQYTRGTWMAPETRRPLLDAETAPYATPSQLVAPLMTRWLLVFEDPESKVLWLGKGTPREWLEDSQTISVSSAPTSAGRVSFRIASHMKRRLIEAHVSLPATDTQREIRLRLRAPDHQRMKSVMLNSKPWNDFDPTSEVVVLPRNASGDIAIAVNY